MVTNHVFFFLFQIALGLYSDESSVVKLTADNFETEVLKSDNLWIVEFFAPWCGHCKKLAPEFEKAAKALKGVVNLGAVDMTTDSAVGQPYSISGYPTIKFFGENKNSPVDYDSGRSAQDIATYAVKKLQQLVNKKLGTSADAKTESTDKKTESADTKPEAETEEIPVNEEDIIVLNDDNFEETVLGNDEVWFVNFHAVWCSHCKRLNPDWAKSATMLKGQVNFVKVDAIYNTRLVAKYDVKSYPTIKIFLPGNETPEDYNGPRDAELLIKEAYKRLDTLGIAPKIPQIVSSQVLNNHCEKDICIIAFLPHIYDSSIAERNRYLEILKVTAKKYRKNPLKYLWAQAGDFLELEKLFGVGFGYPSIAGISLMKNKFALMTSSYINEEIELFSKRLLRGNLPLTEYKDLPSIQTVPLWNENIPAQRENTVTPDEITHQKDGSSEYL